MELEIKVRRDLWRTPARSVNLREDQVAVVASRASARICSYISVLMHCILDGNRFYAVFPCLFGLSTLHCHVSVNVHGEYLTVGEPDSVSSRSLSMFMCARVQCTDGHEGRHARGLSVFPPLSHRHALEV